jgi:MATE family multidrug resistance protein
MTETTSPVTLKQVSRKIFALALPMAFIQLVTIASGFLCMVMVSKLGHEVLAASALIFSTQMSIMVLGMSLLFSLSILVGHAYGAKDYTAIGNYVQQGWTLGVLVSVPIMLFFWHIGSILVYFGQAEPIARIVQDYFHAYIWGVIPTMFAVCNQQLCYGIHKQKLAIITSFLCVGILLTFAYVLIFGKLGMPALGVAGFGYAMAAQSTFYFLFTTYCFFVIEDFRHFNLFQYRVHKGLTHLKQMFQIGWPICVHMGGEMLSFFASAAMVGWLGAHALAAYQVVNQYLYLGVIPIFALSQASGILVGQAVGSKKYQEIDKLGFAAFLLGLAISVTAGCIFLLFPHLLARAYLDVNDPANALTLHLITVLFAIVAVSQLFDAVRNVFTGALRGLLDMKFPMYTGLCVIWVIGLPLGYLLAFACHMGIVGIALGSLTGMLLGAVIIAARWWHVCRKYA